MKITLYLLDDTQKNYIDIDMPIIPAVGDRIRLSYFWPEMPTHLNHLWVIIDRVWSKEEIRYKNKSVKKVFVTLYIKEVD